MTIWQDNTPKRSPRSTAHSQGGRDPTYDAKIARSTIEGLFTGEKVVDLAIRPRERGGSLDELRIWVLVEANEGRRRIMELKQYAKPATAKYRDPPPSNNG